VEPTVCQKITKALVFERRPLSVSEITEITNVDWIEMEHDFNKMLGAGLLRHTDEVRVDLNRVEGAV
jgi:predicted transcriptional regulator